MKHYKVVLLFVALYLLPSSLGGGICLADQIFVGQDAETSFEGRIVEESDDSFLIRVPKSEIRRVEQGDGPMQSRSFDIYIEERGDNLIIILPKDRIRGSIRPAVVGAAEGDVGQRMLRLEQEFEDFREGRENIDMTIASEVQKASTGRVLGRVLWNGEPLPDCEVKLSKEPEFSLANLQPFSSKGDAASVTAEFLAKTDANGRYIFKALPPGSYRVSWRPSGSVDFIRRLSSWSDIGLLPGELVEYKDIEANVRTID